jgi:hypothetical protein
MQSHVHVGRYMCCANRPHRYSVHPVIGSGLQSNNSSRIWSQSLCQTLLRSCCGVMCAEVRIAIIPFTVFGANCKQERRSDYVSTTCIANRLQRRKRITSVTARLSRTMRSSSMARIASDPRTCSCGAGPVRTEIGVMRSSSRSRMKESVSLCV